MPTHAATNTLALRPLVRRWAALTAVSAAGVLAADRSGLAAAAGLNAWRYPQIRHELAEAEEIGERLSYEDALTAERLTAKTETVEKLVRGSTDFAAAVETFAVLNESAPETLDSLRGTHPESRDPRELSARNLLDFVDSHPLPAGADATAVREKLRAEFTHLFPAAR